MRTGWAGLTLSWLASACGASDARPQAAPAVEPSAASAEPPPFPAEELRARVAELTRRVESLEARVPVPTPRSAEWRELDEVGQEVFWQRRFDREKVDKAWAASMVSAFGPIVRADQSVSVRSLECRSTLCRLEVECLNHGECTPDVGFRTIGPPPVPYAGVALGSVRPLPDGAMIKVAFLFREGRSMVPEGNQ